MGLGEILSWALGQAVTPQEHWGALPSGHSSFLSPTFRNLCWFCHKDIYSCANLTENVKKQTKLTIKLFDILFSSEKLQMAREG